MSRHASFVTGRTTLIVVTTLLVAVGAFAPGVVFAQTDADPSPGTATETEPNNITSTANPIQLDQRVRGNLSRYDTDTFVVNVTQPGARITVDLEKDAVGHGTYLSVSVFAAGGRESVGGGAVDDAETEETVNVTARGAGTYYVRLNGDANALAYELEVSTSNVDGVSQEQNRANATPLASGETLNGTLTADTEAWYAVNATAGDELTANLTTDRESEHNVSVQLYGPNGTYVTGDTNVGTDYVRASTVARENGTHYVYLVSTDPNPVDYALTAAVRDTSDQTEPNEDRATATPIETGTNITGELAAGDKDWYAFEAAAGEAILPRLELRGPNRERGIRFDIYGPDGERINAYPNDAIRGDPYVAGVGFISKSGPAEGAAMAETNGTYYVRVSGGDEAENRTGPYTLSVETRRLDPFDPNQRAETATRLTPNVTVNATATAYDPDWFAFDAAAGDRINVSVVSPVQTDMEVVLYLPNETELRNVNFPVTANRSGTYWVVVRQNNIQPSLLTEFPYDLTVNVTGTGTAPADSDGDSLTDDEEAQYGTDPTDPDTDGDGWSDLAETNRGCDPRDAESHP